MDQGHLSSFLLPSLPDAATTTGFQVEHLRFHRRDLRGPEGELGGKLPPPIMSFPVEIVGLMIRAYEFP